MNRALLDTDMLSEILKQRDSNVAARAKEYVAEHGRLLLSSITVLEIVRGYRRVGRETKIASFERAAETRTREPMKAGRGCALTKSPAC